MVSIEGIDVAGLWCREAKAHSNRPCDADFAQRRLTAHLTYRSFLERNSREVEMIRDEYIQRTSLQGITELLR